MIPSFYLARLNQRYQEEPMTCEKPCPDCKCKKPCCDTLPLDADLYNEIDDGTFAPPSQYNPLKEIN